MSTNPFARGGSLTAQLSSHLLPTAGSGAQHTPASPTQSQPTASTSTPPRAAPGTPNKGKGASPRSGLGNELVTPPRVGSSSPFGSPSSSPAAGHSPAQQSADQSPSQNKDDVQSSPGSSVTGSPQSSNGGGNSNRRVKLYKLLDEHWEDLGTGICSTHFNSVPSEHTNSPDKQQPSTPPRSVSSGEDGAWIIVKREPEQPPNDQDPDAPPPPPPKGPPGEVILKTKVFPYPAGYDSSEEDEDESGYDKQGRPLDPGGYQRQQDTLIVWTEKGSDEEMALSFATSSGCAEIWDFIRNARKWAVDDVLTSPSLSPIQSSPQQIPVYSLTNLVARLPDPTLQNLEQVENAIRSMARTAAGRERTATNIVKTDFVQKLIAIHAEAEDLESLDDLHALCRVMQSILLLNDNSVFDLILKDEIILGVASILEYDPEFPTLKASYRAHLSDPSHFTEVVPIRRPALLARIHQTHRLHYLKDVVLSRILEDATFSMLNSAIYFHEIEIINELVNDAAFLAELFAVFEEGAAGAAGKEVPEEGKKAAAIGPQLPPEMIGAAPGASLGASASWVAEVAEQPAKEADEAEVDAEAGAKAAEKAAARRQHDAILLLQQLCTMTKNFQLPQRAGIFRTLSQQGLLRALEVALRQTQSATSPLEAGERAAMRGATVAILMSLVDHDPNNVRAYSLKQHADGKTSLLVFLIGLFHEEDDLGTKAQMAEALRVLVDANGDGGPLEAPPRMRPEDPEAEKFLQFFYDHAISLLLKPIIDLPDRPAGPASATLELTPARMGLHVHLCELLVFFVSHHTFRAKYYVLSSNVATKVARLFDARPKHVKLAALRVLRACVGRNDDFYSRFLIKNDLYRGALELTWAERARDNLASSACLELFEYIRTVNQKAVINHLFEKHASLIKKLANPPVKLATFAALVLKWEQNNEPPPSAAVSTTTEASGSGSTSVVAGAREPTLPTGARVDMEEESYFNGSDDETEEEGDSVEMDAEDAKAAGAGTGAGAEGDSPRTARKREAGGDGEGGSKRARLSKEDGSGEKTGLKRSRPVGVPGVADYGSDEEDELMGAAGAGAINKSPGASPTGKGAVGAAMQREGSKDGLLPGGFIRVGSGSPTKDEATTGSPASSPGAPAPGPPPRRKSQDEDDDDEMGLLARGKGKAPVAGAKAGGIFGGGGFVGAAAGAGGNKKITLSLGAGAKKLEGAAPAKEQEEGN